MTTSDPALGRTLFDTHCIRCHGIRADGGILPDLRYSPYILHATAFRAVLVDGALAARGMVSFADLMDADQVEAVRGYLLKEAESVRDKPK